MLRIKVSNNFKQWPFARQTPGSKGIWGKSEFIINQATDDCDYWVVTGGLDQTEQTLCNEENTVFLGGEPPSLIRFNHNFLKQFKHIITCDRKLKHPNNHFYQQAIPWQIGAYVDKYDYDELKSMQPPKKTKLISAITSSKDWSAGHKNRIKFIHQLKEHFGDSMDVFGRGINEIRDKSMGIIDYKYSIAIENSSYEDYWTEKLGDVFLGYSFPFYFGCPNIGDYFPENSLIQIDINDLSSSIKAIEKAIEDNSFENNIDKIKQSRELVLDKYNFFPMMDTFCRKNYKKGKKTMIELKPEKEFEKYNYKKYFNPKKVFLFVKRKLLS